MPRRKKVLTKTRRVKAVARQRIGPPKPARPLEERSQKAKPKYPADWLNDTEPDPQ